MVEERANDWLKGVGKESDEVKDLILQTMCVTFLPWTGLDCVLTGYDYGPDLTISHGLLRSGVISHVR